MLTLRCYSLFIGSPKKLLEFFATNLSDYLMSLFYMSPSRHESGVVVALCVITKAAMQHAVL